MALRTKNDLINYNLSSKELDIVLINLNNGEHFFIDRVLDKMDTGMSFYAAFKEMYTLQANLDLSHAIYKRECEYWDQMNEIYCNS